MVFSFFKKKPPPKPVAPEVRMPVRAPARPKPTPTEAEKARAAKAAVKASESRAAASVYGKGPAAAPAKPVSPYEAGRRQAHPTTEVIRPAVPQKDVDDAEVVLTISAFEREFTRSSVMAIDVGHVDEAWLADLEQIAISFGNGQDTLARSLLESAIDAHRGPGSERFWRMYLALLQIQGDKAAYEAACNGFSALCGVCPPAWSDHRALAGGQGAASRRIALKGELAASNATALLPLLGALDREQPFVLELSELRACDDAIASQLMAALQRALSEGIAVAVEGCDALLVHLQRRLLVSREAGQRGSWELYLDLLQRTGRDAVFAEVARRYATLFEQPAPEWDPVRVQPGGAPGGLVQGLDAHYFSGDITTHRFEELVAVAGQKSCPILDFSRVRRMDFFSAGQLVNRLANLRRPGQSFVIRSPNPLVAELMAVVGVHHQAQIFVPKD